jgi:hypothetical protein
MEMLALLIVTRIATWGGHSRTCHSMVALLTLSAKAIEADETLHKLAGVVRIWVEPRENSAFRTPGLRYSVGPDNIIFRVTVRGDLTDCSYLVPTMVDYGYNRWGSWLPAHVPQSSLVISVLLVLSSCITSTVRPFQSERNWLT